jgi:hypothetical protein
MLMLACFARFSRLLVQGLLVAALAMPAVAQEALSSLPASAVAVSGTLSVGTNAYVQWNGSWYNASILQGPNEAGQYYIHYTGWESSWDEWVGLDRLRVEGTACNIGRSVEVLWQGSYYAAQIIAGPNDQGQCMIHYDGYESSWDEWVGSDRIR